MSWSTANADLRTLLSDGATDKLRWTKKLVGRVDGVNTYFKSLEKRRLSNLKTDVGPSVGVYVNSVRLDQATQITSDDPEVGVVKLVAAPTAGQYVEATYYVQWFLDAELDTFLLAGATWLGLSATADVPGGLRNAAKYYAAQEAYHKLALRWAESLSQDFKLEDAPEKGAETPMEMYRKLAEDARKKAVQLRDQYYEGQGAENKPSFSSIPGCVKEVVPRR